MAQIEGYALLFNSRSQDLGGFVEVIKPGALDGIIPENDILSWLNHDKQKGLLARSTQGRGSLKLTVDQKGLKYNFEAPETPVGTELVQGIKRGDIRASSFVFKVDGAGQKWEELPDGTYLRTITKFAEICDVSPVYFEAYKGTSVKIV